MHYHLSADGSLCLGEKFDGQWIMPFDFWTYMWNDLVTLLPIFSPFFANEHRFRESAFKGKKWCSPVYDRLSVEQVKNLFKFKMVRGKYTTIDSPCNEFVLGHQYGAIAWNRKNLQDGSEGKVKKTATIELRLNEVHPYFSIPVIERICSLVKKTFDRFCSVKLKDHRVIKDWWNLIMESDVYLAMKEIKGIEFHEGREPPIIADPGEKFETGLDFFRKACYRFSRSNAKTELKTPKIMRMFSDCIDFERVPPELVWDIEQLYYDLYDSPNSKDNQKKWLYFGPSIVLDPDKNPSDYPVRKLLEGQ